MPLPYLALIAANIIWGLNFVVAKITLGEFPVMSLAFLRFAFAGLLLAPFLFSEQSNASKKEQIKIADIPRFVVAGLFLVSFHISLFYLGLSRTEAINASVLSMIVPIISVIAGWIILKEKVYWINLVGSLTGLFGALVVIGVPLLLFGTVTTSTLLGNFLIVLSSISFVIGALLCRQLLRKYSALSVTASLFLIAVVSFLIPAAKDYLDNPNWVMHVSVLGLLGFCFIVLLSTVSAFFMYEWGVKKVGLIQADLVQYIQPAIAATLAVPLLGERISFSFIIGTCLVILGVYWGTLGKPDHHHHLLRHHRS